VFRGENELNASIVRAVKIILPDLAQRPEFVQRFMREAALLEALQHPNVVRFYGLRRVERAKEALLVMELELLEGAPLSDVIERGRALATGAADVKSALAWLRDAAAGVAAAHRLGIVHRDLKPENLYLTAKNELKVLDFGIARALDDADREERLTRVGVVPGSPAYMAPEVCTGGAPTASADVYALGIVLLEVLLGRHPFAQAAGSKLSSTQLMYAHVHTEAPKLRDVRPDAPSILEQVVERACAKDPSWRYKDAAELHEALARVAEEIQAGASTKAADAAGTQFVLPAVFSRKTPTAAGGTPTGTSTSSAANAALASQRGGEPAGKSRAPILVGAAVVIAAVAAGAVLFPRSNAAGPPTAGSAAAASVRPTATAAPTASTSAPQTAPSPAGTSTAQAASNVNPWVRIKPPTGAKPLALGVTDGDGAQRGFRPGKKVAAPTHEYEIQQHEVTWGELAPIEVPASLPAWLPQDPAAREKWPVTGLSWSAALKHCKSVGGTLPTEEEWEYAARGPDLRPHPWGAQLLDLGRVRAFKRTADRPDGPPAPPVDVVMASDQDVTPGDGQTAIFDLAGNAQEWTVDVFREDRPGADEGWTQADGVVYRAVRGLPLDEAPPKALPRFTGAHRSALCTGEKCPADVADALPYVGFRCVRRVK
jgi:formylglycine-generating enzyme required for sulfatase activity